MDVGNGELQQREGQRGEHHHHHEVTVTVDSKPQRVAEGDYVVSEFKKLVGVPPDKELDEVLHGELKPLNDNQRIEIKGGEVFISHSRQGGSS